jgi:Fur family ferric uptake transcriptional regulator
VRHAATFQTSRTSAVGRCRSAAYDPAAPVVEARGAIRVSALGGSRASAACPGVIRQFEQPMAEGTDENLRARIRSAGLRCTAARLAVLRQLESAASPITHGEVVELLQGSGFDQSTIYRNLIDLAEAGLVRRQELGDHVWRFEPRREGEHAGEEHAHFLCVDCGSVRCLPEVRLDSTSRTAAAKIGDVTEVLIKGHCMECVPPR